MAGILAEVACTETYSALSPLSGTSVDMRLTKQHVAVAVGANRLLLPAQQVGPGCEVLDVPVLQPATQTA